MANPRLIKKRVGSIKNIGKITKALEMVSASKIQKAQNKAISAKPYALAIYELIGNLSGDSEIAGIPLMRQSGEVRNDLYILISTNRGLAGSLNTNLFRKIEVYIGGKSEANHHFITIGKKGRNYALANGTLEADLSSEKESGTIIAAITNIITDGFIGEKFDEVYIVYSDFITALTQSPTIKKILPIERKVLKEEVEAGTFDIVGREGEKRSDTLAEKTNYYYEPDPVTVLSNLLPFYLEIQIAEALFEAEASEHSARMIAMKNASDNASELSGGLALLYNKARQAAITTEISDITTAQATLR